jgi:ankyrin repeat protein
MVKALMPENVFTSNPAAADMAISQGQASSALDFLKLAMYLVSNNFCSATADVSKEVYAWLKRRSNTGLLEYLLSIGGPTIDALVENFFRLAIDADDVHTVRKMMDLGIDPNEQIYRGGRSLVMTPLQRACEIQSLELVRVLIDGGAKVNLPAESDAYSALMYAVDPRDENYDLKGHVDIELVRILLRAGAAVNPGIGVSPLSYAAESGHVELVALLVAEGADVHFSDEEDMSTPLMTAVQCDMDIPDRDVVSIVHTLLRAGADAQVYVQDSDGDVVTALEAAIPRKSVELVQLLLDNGARITQSAFVTAAKHGDLNIARLLFKSGAKVTEAVIESAVDNDGTELVIFLLETADDKVKNRCKSAALIKAIEHGKGDLMDWLDSSGAQLDSNFRLTDAIHAAAKRGDMRVFRLLLHENSRYRTTVIESLGAALSIAISNGRNDAVEILLAAGADVNRTVTDMAGVRIYGTETPLFAAIRRKDSNLATKTLGCWRRSE